jgi:hypothetical protein
MGDIGIEWVLDYSGRPGFPSPANTQANAEGFFNTLNATQQFAHGNGDAQDKHFEKAGKGAPRAGTASAVVETVDMIYFAGHGTTGALEFGVFEDDARAKPAEIRWGNGRLKWVVINACDVLFDSPDTHAIDRWGQTFTGLRYIFGFGSLAFDEPDRGRIFAEYVNAGNTVREAWVKACQDTEPSAGIWAYLRADGNGVSTDKDAWPADATASTKPDPPDVVHYVQGAC